MMDNRVFNINGEGPDMLKRVLALAFEQSGNSKCPAYETTDKGLVLLWCKTDRSIPFPAPLDADQASLVVWSWLESDDAKSIKLSGWDIDYDHDGDNEPGWRVFCEDWGHVGSSHYSIVAITPAFMWHGK